MAAITDGTFTSPLQDGDKQVVFPFDFLGDAYARIISRPYVMLSSSYSAPRTLTTTSVTNYALRSETFANASWTKTNVTATDNGYYNPHNGAQTATVMAETATSAEHRVEQAYTTTAVSHALSCYVRADGRDYIRLMIYDGTNFHTCFFNLSAGSVGTASGGVTGSITNAGNSWWRVGMVVTPAAGSGSIYISASTDGSTVSYAGDITKGLILWGAQLERASSISTYLPTTSATRTSALRTRDVSDNSGDSAADQFAFLCQETPPDQGSLRQGIARLAREYCRVPASQVSYPGSIYLNLPTPPDLNATAISAYSVDSTLGTTTALGTGSLFKSSGGSLYNWFPNNKFYGAMKTGYPSQAKATGGTFTLTYGANTTAALNWNDAAATIAAALNALASVIADGVVFGTCFNNLNTTGLIQLNTTLTSPTTSTPVTMNASGLTPAAATTAFTQVTAGTQQNIYIAGRATIPSHGLSGTISCQTTTSYLELPSTRWTSIDANTIAYDYMVVGGQSPALYFGNYLRAYTPTTRLIGTKQTEEFYYPGWSPGITTGADITRTTGLQTDQLLVDALLTQTGFQTYRSEGPEIWRGPILSVKLTAINLDDIT